jgi:ribonuclease P protein component
MTAARRTCEGLPRSRILRNRTLLRQIRAEGRRCSSRWITLFVQKPKMETAPATGEVAFMTPRKIGPATTRNRVRRRMREIYRRCLSAEVETARRLWIARPGSAQLSFAELKAAMLQLAAS